MSLFVRCGTARGITAQDGSAGLTVWHEIRDGAHARSHQAFRPVQSLHESSSRVVDYERVCRFAATAKREFGRFVLARLAMSGCGMEACA